MHTTLARRPLIGGYRQDVVYRKGTHLFAKKRSHNVSGARRRALPAGSNLSPIRRQDLYGLPFSASPCEQAVCDTQISQLESLRRRNYGTQQIAAANVHVYSVWISMHEWLFAAVVRPSETFLYTPCARRPTHRRILFGNAYGGGTVKRSECCAAYT